jgi:hypothetical protein
MFPPEPKHIPSKPSSLASKALCCEIIRSGRGSTASLSVTFAIGTVYFSFFPNAGLTVSSKADLLMSTTATLAPRQRRFKINPHRMPLPPPVTTKTVFRTFISKFSLLRASFPQCVLCISPACMRPTARRSTARPFPHGFRIKSSFQDHPGGDAWPKAKFGATRGRVHEKTLYMEFSCRKKVPLPTASYQLTSQISFIAVCISESISALSSSGKNPKVQTNSRTRTTIFLCSTENKGKYSERSS